MDGVRKIIEEKLAARKQSMAWLSRELGRSHAYIQQYLKTGTPQDLEYQDKLRISSLLGVPLMALGLAIPPALAPSPGAASLGFANDVESAELPKGHYLAPSGPHIEIKKAVSSALDRHRLNIQPGDLIVTDSSEKALQSVTSDDAVVVLLYDKESLLKATTVLRQFVAPGLLITNSSEGNSILSMEDRDLPFEPIIEAKIVSVLRQ